LVGVDYNDDDPSKAQAQVEAMLQKTPDLGGIFGTNVFSAQGLLAIKEAVEGAGSADPKAVNERLRKLSIPGVLRISFSLCLILPCSGTRWASPTTMPVRASGSRIFR
jgi:hypothetical protein